MTKTNTPRVWVIRAGRGGKAHDLFVEKSLIALDDAELGDLATIGATREAFYAAYRDKHPEETRSGSAGVGGKFYRFVHEVRTGHLIVYPARPDKQVYIGEVTGQYEFVPSSNYPHQRKVKWKYVIPKGDFTLPAQYELGAARTFFKFKKNVPELLDKISGKEVARFRKGKKTK